MNIAHLKKQELIWMGSHRCKHGHTYLSHLKCYEKDKARPERIAYFDIEASNLVADFGILLSWSILDSATGRIDYAVLNKQDIDSGAEDKRLLRALIKALRPFDRIVGYYSSRFDVPFVRARCAIQKVLFPAFGTIKHTDLFFLIRTRFKISSRRQENACRVVLGKTRKTRLDQKHWRSALSGKKKSLAYILDHNKKDVLDLRDLHVATKDFGRHTDTSI
jgi:uncharacterized protein YprB with RNaseH-like and TPR domain